MRSGWPASRAPPTCTARHRSVHYVGLLPEGLSGLVEGRSTPRSRRTSTSASSGPCRCPRRRMRARDPTAALGHELQGSGDEVPARRQRRRRPARQGLLRRDALDTVRRQPDARFRQGGDRGREPRQQSGQRARHPGDQLDQPRLRQSLFGPRVASRRTRRFASTPVSPSCSTISTAGRPAATSSSRCRPITAS